MLRLIKSELRKLFLSPLSLIVIVLLIGYYGYSAYDVCVNRIAPYELHPLPSLGLSFETAEGEPLDSKPAVNRYVHSVLSRYQGTADMTLWQQYMEDYNKCSRRLTKDIDEPKMKEFYGEDWKELLSRNENGTLNEQDIARIQTLYNAESDPANDSALQELNTIPSENTTKQKIVFICMSFMKKKIRSLPSIISISRIFIHFTVQEK